MSEIEQGTQIYNARNPSVDIFILTKPPNHDRAIICWKLVSKSKNAVLYLAGDGVYNLFCAAINGIPVENIFVCREDVEARGVQVEERAIVLSDFYDEMIRSMMDEMNGLYTF